MAEFAALPLFTDAWIADTAHLARAERGLYHDLIVLMWRSPECRIPNDPAWIERKLRCEGNEGDVLKRLLAEFCLTDGNWVWQKRLKKEHDYTRQKRRSQSDAAKSRWNNEKTPCVRNAPSPSPSPSPTPTKKEKTPAAPVNGNGHLPEGISPLATPEPTTLEAEFYGRGKQVLGKSAGGLLTRLLKARGGNVALARASLELASTKEDPREFIGAAIRNANAEQNPREVAGGRL